MYITYMYVYLLKVCYISDVESTRGDNITIVEPSNCHFVDDLTRRKTLTLWDGIGERVEGSSELTKHYMKTEDFIYIFNMWTNRLLNSLLFHVHVYAYLPQVIHLTVCYMTVPCILATKYVPNISRNDTFLFFAANSTLIFW